MNTKNILILAVVLALIALGGFWYASSKNGADYSNENEGERVGDIENVNQPEGKIKADTFSGKLEEVNTGCFADAECYVTVDGKHVTAIMGWSRDTVGSVIGVPSFGDLESKIGQEVEVYAQEKEDGTYTLYGSEGFYIKLK